MGLSTLPGEFCHDQSGRPAPTTALDPGDRTRSYFAPPATLNLNEEALYRVVMPEANNAYLPKGVDADNQAGLFRKYNPSGRSGGGASHESQVFLPHALVSTLLDGPQTVFFHLASTFTYQRG